MDLEDRPVNTFNSDNCPPEITSHILKIAAEQEILALGTDASFKVVFGSLRLVCKNWQAIIDNQIKKNKEGSWANQKKEFWINALISAYASLGYGDDCRNFLNGKLIYTPHKGKPIELLISGLEKPFMGEFDLSKCGDDGKYLSISTGYRKEKKAENQNKVEIWFTPGFMATNAKHLTPILEQWDTTKVPVGIFWNNGWWDKLDWYDYLVSHNLAGLTNQNLYKLWKKSTSCEYLHFTFARRHQHVLQTFSCSFGEPKLDLT